MGPRFQRFVGARLLGALSAGRRGEELPSKATLPSTTPRSSHFSPMWQPATSIFAWPNAGWNCCGRMSKSRRKCSRYPRPGSNAEPRLSWTCSRAGSTWRRPSLRCRPCGLLCGNRTISCACCSAFHLRSLVSRSHRSPWPPRRSPRAFPPTCCAGGPTSARRKGKWQRERRSASPNRTCIHAFRFSASWAMGPISFRKCSPPTASLA